MKTLIASLFILIGSFGAANAQELPAGVLKAEMAEDWPQASKLLLQALGQQPDNQAWWKRLAQIQAAQGNRDGAADALIKAAQSSTPEASLYAEASAALAYANRPDEALSAILKARQLAPDNIDYASREIALSNWLGDTERTLGLLKSLWQQQAAIPNLGYQYAQALSWNGQTDASRAVLLRYLQDQADHAPAMLLLSRLESWRGDYTQSLYWLDRYRDTGGDLVTYLSEKSAVLAWADRPHDAISSLAELPDTPQSQAGRSYAEAVAYRKLNRNAALSARLNELRSARTDGIVDPDGLAMYLTTSLRDNIGINSQYSSDSDGIDIWKTEGSLRWWAGPHVVLDAIVAPHRINLSKANSALAADSTNSAVEMMQLSIGGTWFPSSHWKIRLAGGQAFVDDPESDRMSIGQLALAYRPNDTLRLTASADRSPHAVSPRALDRAISRDELALSLDWQPDLRWSIRLRLAQADFSSESDCIACEDDNQREQLQFSALRRMLFRQDWNLSAGFRAIITRFDKDLDNGYYDPKRFDNLAVVSNLYYAFSQNRGLALSGALGAQRDPALDSSFTPAADISAQFSSGIWADTLLTLRLAGSYGVSRVGDDYSALSVGLGIERRF